MGVLDNDYIRIKEKPWLISLVCTIFVVYPNVAWLHCELTFLARNEQLNFILFTLFRFLFFWAFIWGAIRYNFMRLSTPHFLRRLGWNSLITLVAFLVYMVITHLTQNYDRFLSILVFQFIVMCLLNTLVGYITLLYSLQREKDQEIEQLRIENLQSQCNALTNQINPHFFFNALNGISALIRRKNDESTLLYVTKLSDIFRYTLQSEKKGLVTLEEELAFAEAFSHVMEVRFSGKFFVHFEVPEDKRQLRIPVLSLLPLIENTTVHNAIDSENPMHIHIQLNIQQELVISNPICPKLTPPDTNGTGLNNLRNRFKLLVHSDIRIQNDGQTFTVYLPLK